MPLSDCISRNLVLRIFLYIYLGILSVCFSSPTCIFFWVKFPAVMLEANVFSLYLFSWRRWEMINDRLFNKFCLSNSFGFSVTHRLQCFENLQLPISIEKRLSSLSSSKKFIEETTPFYEQHLLKCRYKEKLNCSISNVIIKKESQRNILWFNLIES